MADCSWFRSVIESIDPALGAAAQRGCYAGLNSVLPGHRPDFPAPLGFSLDAIRHWDGGRRTPEAPARTPLTVIDRNPTAMLTARRLGCGWGLFQAERSIHECKEVDEERFVKF